MNFYASEQYLAAAAEVYFPGRRYTIEDVRVGDQVLRLLVLDGKQVVTHLEFLDYHEAVRSPDPSRPVRKTGYVASVVRQTIGAPAWETFKGQGFEPAPFVDWSRFSTFADYTAFLRTKSKSLLKEQERRRRRLAETLGTLEFCAHDQGEDVLELAGRWKSQQLHETGARNYLTNPKNLEFLQRLRAESILVSSTLRANRRLLSVWIGFIHARVWSGWIFTYDPEPELRRYSLGHQLLHAMLEESHRQGHHEFDFSIGDEGYKWFYATHARLLAPVGRPPLQQRVLAQSKSYAKRALAGSPALLEAAATLKKKARRQRGRLQTLLGGAGSGRAYSTATGRAVPGSGETE